MLTQKKTLVNTFFAVSRHIFYGIRGCERRLTLPYRTFRAVCAAPDYHFKNFCRLETSISFPSTISTLIK